jgi:ribulose kinase
MISGLRLTDSADSLALLYFATIQAIAYGTRHIVESMNASGYRIDTLVACGGDTKNPLFVREHADITGCRVILPAEREAVLLGSAMLAATAAGDVPDLVTAMTTMTRADTVIAPHPCRYHDQKYAVFHRMHADQLAYRALMHDG